MIRRLTDCIQLFIPVVGIVYILQIPSRIGIPISLENYLGVFLALVLACMQIDRLNSRKVSVRIAAIVLLMLSLLCGGFIAVSFPAILLTMGQPNFEVVLLGSITIILILDACHQLKATVLVLIVILFILYARYADLLPGIMYTRKIPWHRIVSYIYLDSNAILGIPLAVSAKILLSFLLFGQCLVKLGGSDALTDFAYALMGKFRGGPAKVAVVSSGLFGSVSGSAVSNVTTTGIVTIPMMKSLGYKPQVAGAIESVASTGGLVTPPVMGTVAFLISQFLEIPYSDVVVASAAPAILLYLYLFIYVDLEAARNGIQGLPSDKIPKVSHVFREVWPFFCALVLFIYLLIIEGWDESLSALVCSASMLLIGIFQRRLSWKVLSEIFVETSRAVSMVAILCAAAGIVVGIISLSGLGTKISQLLVDSAGQATYILLLLTAATCILLGMGMPAAPAYLLLAMLIAPALVQLGIEPLGAHLFIFYFGAVSFVTPPVCLAVFAAAAIAKSDITRTGLTAIKLAVPFYVLPFLFIYEPALLFKGDFGSIVYCFGTALLGVSSIAVGMAGFFLGRLGFPLRLCFVFGGMGLALPSLRTDYVGVVFLGGAIILQVVSGIKGKRSERAV